MGIPTQVAQVGTAILGIVGVEAADTVNQTIEHAPSNLVTAALQVLIGLVTIYKLIKQKGGQK